MAGRVSAEFIHEESAKQLRKEGHDIPEVRWVDKSDELKSLMPADRAMVCKRLWVLRELVIKSHPEADLEDIRHVLLRDVSSKPHAFSDKVELFLRHALRKRERLLPGCELAPERGDFCSVLEMIADPFTSRDAFTTVLNVIDVDEREVSGVMPPGTTNAYIRKLQDMHNRPMTTEELRAGTALYPAGPLDAAYAKNREAIMERLG